jgi:hypothetical protein
MFSRGVLRKIGLAFGFGLIFAGGPMMGPGVNKEEPHLDGFGNKGRDLTPTEKGSLLKLQKQLLRYFLDNQVRNGFIRDRQRNHGSLRDSGATSSSSTGMGIIAIALASAKEYDVIPRQEAEERIVKALEHALTVPEVGGMIAHFYGEDDKPMATDDTIATIDSAWLIAGGLWAAQFTESPRIDALAGRLHERVDWLRWTDPSDKLRPLLLRHGMAHNGHPLLTRWDRLSPENAFMYLMAVGSCGTKNVRQDVWKQLSPHWGDLRGHRVASPELGLFTHRWSLLLFDFKPYKFADGLNLANEGDLAAVLNCMLCQDMKSKYKTFERFWCLSAGDGPPDNQHKEDTYREYSPAYCDGTANIMASLTALECCTDDVLANLAAAEAHGDIMGRYGPSSVNFADGKNFISQDVIATDVAAAILAIDNALFNGRPRRVFEEVPCIAAARKALEDYRRY